MDSRAAEVTHTESDHLQALPPELQLSILNRLDIPSVLKMQQTSCYYQHLLNDHVFWKQKHDQKFLPTPFNDNSNNDNKNQYQAAWLYQRANLANGKDRQQIAFQKLFRFLKPHSRPWTHYYHGLLHHQGEGTKKNTYHGFLKLLDALDYKDYRAAIKIANILIECKINDSELFKKCLSFMIDKHLQLILTLIQSTHHNKIENLSKLLARLYAHGIGVTPDFIQAEKYFIGSMNNTADDIGELALLRFNSLSNSLQPEQKADETIIYLKSFTNKFPTDALQTIITYWSAYLAVCRRENNEAIHLLQTINHFPFARLQLAHLLLEQNQHPQLAIEQLGYINGNQEDIARELFDIQTPLYFSLRERVAATKALTNCRMIEIADKVSAEYREEMDMETLAADPYVVWWIQLAAQAGCIQSLEALQSVKPEKYPYICYALGIIYEFGILHSDTIEPNHDKAEYYFNLARNHTDLDTYLLTGTGEDFGCQEVVDFLKSKLTSSPRLK